MTELPGIKWVFGKEPGLRQTMFNLSFKDRFQPVVSREQEFIISGLEDMFTFLLNSSSITNNEARDNPIFVDPAKTT